MSRLSKLLMESRPLVMGVLNVTPDSFSDGNQFLSLAASSEHAQRMASAGADIIDVGGESTRPGAKNITIDEELERVIPVISRIRSASDVCISVDTSSPEVMSEAAIQGADLINDVRALRRDKALDAAKKTGLPICLMHMKGNPETMQMNPRYEDLFNEVNEFFRERITICEAAGISRDRLLLDPGFGFGKMPEHNLQLVNRLEMFRCHGLPLLVGLSRKSTLSRITDNLLIASVVGAIASLQHGARIVRVHDVAETVSAIRVSEAIRKESLEAL